MGVIRIIFSFSRMLSQHFSDSTILLLWVAACGILVYYMSRPRRIFMLGFSCYKPADDTKCNYELAEYIALRSEKFSDESLEFMRRIYQKSGMGDETYFPPFVFRENPVESLEAAQVEAAEVTFGAVEQLLKSCGLNGGDIDIIVATCSMYSAAPSLTSMLINRYNMKEDIQSINIAGMGCSSGVMAVNTAYDLLRTRRGSGYALVVLTENITLNSYYGQNRSMLVTNCLFRVGCAAIILSSKPGDRCRSKLELLRSVRTHRGADDKAYRAAFQEEDEEGGVGISLTKDLIRVAGEGLHEHIRCLAPLVLPYSEQIKYVWSLVATNILRMDTKPYTPDFCKAFEHFCIHTGGKAVINEVSRSLQLNEYLIEPARMVLHRFGNTSSSLVFYELAYFEAKSRIRKGDRIWMIAFGTGFKCSSIVWKAVHDLTPSPSANPWLDVIHRYPVHCNV